MSEKNTPPLSLYVLALIDDLFDSPQRAMVRARIAAATGTISESPAAYERCRIAALKLSGGEMAGLDRALALFEVDYRDLLMSAGFGYDTRAHLSWQPEKR